MFDHVGEILLLIGLCLDPPVEGSLILRRAAPCLGQPRHTADTRNSAMARILRWKATSPLIEAKRFDSWNWLLNPLLSAETRYTAPWVVACAATWRHSITPCYCANGQRISQFPPAASGLPHIVTTGSRRLDCENRWAMSCTARPCTQCALPLNVFCPSGDPQHHHTPGSIESEEAVFRHKGPNVLDSIGCIGMPTLMEIHSECTVASQIAMRDLFDVATWPIMSSVVFRCEDATKNVVLSVSRPIASSRQLTKRDGKYIRRRRTIFVPVAPHAYRAQSCFLPLSIDDPQD